MRFIVSGGGTGGHIYPALAIAGGLSEAFPGAEILYVGAKGGMEEEIAPRENIPFASISVAGLKRKLTLENLSVLWQACRGFGEARGIIRKFCPDAVIGTGGYVCGPVILAAALKKIPTLIHEQNAYPGITNRLLSRVAGCVAVTFADCVKYFPARAKIALTGLPVRPEILAADREAARAGLGLEKDKPLLLSFGGSRGARTINEGMLEVIAKLGASGDFNLIHITGNQGYPEFLDRAEAAGLDLSSYKNVSVKPYIYEMKDYLAAADLVISRAGATTLAELTVLGLPSVLVPYPYAAENHQDFNARALERENAALVIPDRELNGDVLNGHVTELFGDPERLAAMRTASKKLGRAAALEEIIACVKGLIKNY